MPQECRDHLAVVSEAQLFKAAMAQQRWAFKRLPVDGLIAFQKYLDVTYASELPKEVKSPGDVKAAVNICLPEKIEERFEIQFDQQTMSPTITSFRRNRHGLQRRAAWAGAGAGCKFPNRGRGKLCSSGQGERPILSEERLSSGV